MLCNLKTLKARDQIFQKKTKKRWLKAAKNYQADYKQSNTGSKSSSQVIKEKLGDRRQKYLIQNIL